jgi:hypothetical protein
VVLLPAMLALLLWSVFIPDLLYSSDKEVWKRHTAGDVDRLIPFPACLVSHDRLKFYFYLRVSGRKSIIINIPYFSIE